MPGLRNQCGGIGLEALPQVELSKGCGRNFPKFGKAKQIPPLPNNIGENSLDDTMPSLVPSVSLESRVAAFQDEPGIQPQLNVTGNSHAA
eukprot:12091316-Heterocapsa_arctica.AAC.1